MNLVPIDLVRPSTYNPREVDLERLKMVGHSLKKLGFVLPLYADANGEILSGHQRHHVARDLDFKAVPVEYLPAMPLNVRKAVNIAFNRGTNDFSQSSGSGQVTELLLKHDIEQMSSELPDAEGEERFPCMQQKPVKVWQLVEANVGRWIPYARNMARTLANVNIHMPVVIDPEYSVINGIGRVQYYAEQKKDTINVVVIPSQKAPFARLMLNYLSMNFDLHNRYRDFLRHNSFRRNHQVRYQLGKGFIHWVAPGATCKDFDVRKPENSSLWICKHGKNVVDFGAGHLHEAKILKTIGVNVLPFEPYRVISGEICKTESLACCRRFLDGIAEGRKFDSVFISSVLNSIPFAEDRRHIVRICAALCHPETRLYACASNSVHINIKQVSGYESLNERQSGSNTFRLDYEPGITVSDITEAPKVQKYHSGKEFYDLFKEFFFAVKVTNADSNVYAECAGPRPVDLKELRKSVYFEFDLPYPDGTRIGLVTEALAAFEKRFQIIGGAEQ